jgi:hypothetical protein
VRVRYAVSRDIHDWFPIFFRPDCERTVFDPSTGNDESLYDLIQRLDVAGYDLLETPPKGPNE